jgi:putative ABC transport system ATP-binding protein
MAEVTTADSLALGPGSARPPAPSGPATPPTVATPALELRDLFKIYREGDVETVALRGAWLSVAPGEFVAVVGPSGSGKSTLLGMAAGLTAPTAGRVLVAGHDLGAADEAARADLRRRHVGIVLQRDNLIPFLTALENVELALEHGGSDDPRAGATALLERVGLGDRLHHRPAQLSGGEQQRVAVAIALANRPAVLLADEPTGELDSVNAAAIAGLLVELNRERGTAVILVTHNLELAMQADRRVRMGDGLLTPFEPDVDHGRPLVEPAPVQPARAAPGRPLLEARGLTRNYPGGVAALRGVDLSVRAGESVAVMGPSGCGKSTLLNILGGLDRPTAGEVAVDGQVLSRLDAGRLVLLRRRAIGVVFQAHNLLATLTAVENAALPLILDGVAEPVWRARALDLLNAVGLPEVAEKLPDQLSGGQRQRVAVARSLAHGPTLLLADEPTGALDGDGGLEVLELFRRLHDGGQTIIMVTHSPDVAAGAGRAVRLRDGRVESP